MTRLEWKKDQVNIMTKRSKIYEYQIRNARTVRCELK